METVDIIAGCLVLIGLGLGFGYWVWRLIFDFKKITSFDIGTGWLSYPILGVLIVCSFPILIIYLLDMLGEKIKNKKK